MTIVFDEDAISRGTRQDLRGMKKEEAIVCKVSVLREYCTRWSNIINSL